MSAENTTPRITAGNCDVMQTTTTTENEPTDVHNGPETQKTMSKKRPVKNKNEMRAKCNNLTPSDVITKSERAKPWLGGISKIYDGFY